MSNQLHGLLDSLSGNAAVFSEHMQEMQMGDVSIETLEGGKEAVCFYAGGVGDLEGFKIVRELVRLPYPVCWIEMTMESHGISFLTGYLMWEANGSTCSFVWRKLKGEWRFLFGFEVSSSMVPKYHYLPPEAKTLDISSVVVKPLVFLTALNCTNVTKVEHAPDAKLQRARARRGKKPLFSYWTLALNIPGEKAGGGSGEGSHSAPRLHLCRGHIKRRKTGYFWWQPHVRGNKKAGMVHKDYAANYAPPDDKD